MLYYIPAVLRPDPDKIRDAGLAYAFDGLPKTKPIAAEVFHGPLDGPGGIILADRAAYDPDRVGYYPDRQTWRKVPGAKSVTEHGHVCVGFYHDAPELKPTPEKLARKSELPGHLVELADGNQWHCPAALRWQPGEDTLPMRTLPHSYDLDEEGNWTPGDILPDYRGLWEAAERWETFKCSHFNEENESVVAQINLSDIFNDAVLCLATNYRLGAVEVATLGLLTELGAAAVLNALTDEPGYQQISQKKTDD